MIHLVAVLVLVIVVLLITLYMSGSRVKFLESELRGEQWAHTQTQRAKKEASAILLFYEDQLQLFKKRKLGARFWHEIAMEAKFFYRNRVLPAGQEVVNEIKEGENLAEGIIASAVGKATGKESPAAGEADSGRSDASDVGSGSSH